jgi:single-stranded DNA-binding protein
MAINNIITLTGNLGAEADIIETDNTTFAAIRLATTDSYKDEEADKWVELETIWHDVVTFSPVLIQVLKSLKTGTRIKVEGSLNYRPYPIMHEGKEITKKEASIVARKIELAPLVKKKVADQVAHDPETGEVQK